SKTITIAGNPASVGFNGPSSGVVNQSLAYNGGFSDPDSYSWTVKVNYGDNPTWSVVPFNAADHTFNFGHAYTYRGTYTIQVLVTDETGVSGSYSQTVNIAGAPNVWWNQAPSAAVPGQPLTFTGIINDPDSTSWTARVNYNDGTGWHPLTINPDRTFSFNV